MSHRQQVFLFVNPTSGGGRANDYLKLGKEHIPFERPAADLHIYNIKKGDSGKKPGFLKLQEEVEKATEPIHMMVAGGDGTVMWGLSEILATGIDVCRVAVGIIPFGTGNDFSRTLGWGTGPAADLNSDAALTRDMLKWVESDTCDFDMWEVEAVTGADGNFLFVHDQKKGLTDQDMVQHQITKLPNGGYRMKKPMVNYFGSGFADRAGLGFEKKRTKSKMRNNMRYAWEGMKKQMLKQPNTLNEIIESISVGEPQSKRSSSNGDDSTTAEPSIDTSSVVLSMNPTESVCFKGKISELICINVPSYAGGAHPWQWANTTGLNDPEKCAGCPETLKNAEQDIGDGKLELMAYYSTMAFAVDSANSKVKFPGKGYGRRIMQSEGPYNLNFKSEATYKKDGRAYFQIDGEFFVIRYPERVTIRHLAKAKVLRNNAPIPNGCC